MLPRLFSFRGSARCRPNAAVASRAVCENAGSKATIVASFLGLLGVATILLCLVGESLPE